MKTYAEKNWGDCSKTVAYSLNFVEISIKHREPLHWCRHADKRKFTAKTYVLSDIIFNSNYTKTK